MLHIRVIDRFPTDLMVTVIGTFFVRFPHPIHAIIFVRLLVRRNQCQVSQFVALSCSKAAPFRSRESQLSLSWMAMRLRRREALTNPSECSLAASLRTATDRLRLKQTIKTR